MSIISKPCRGERLPCHCERSEAISFRVLAIFLCAFLFSSCSDFDGPWSFYPEDSVAYKGIYTHGYVVAGQKPHICFSKLYNLDESASENFAFYDSAAVTVSGKFSNGDTLVELSSISNKPNCFTTNAEALGVVGESYTMNAAFKWDSAGEKVKSQYSGVAKIGQKSRQRPETDSQYT